MTANQISHYENLKKQDLQHRELIRKLQGEIQTLKANQSKPTDEEAEKKIRYLIREGQIKNKPGEEYKEEYLGFMACFNWLRDR